MAILKRNPFPRIEEDVIHPPLPNEHIPVNIVADEVEGNFLFNNPQPLGFDEQEIQLRNEQEIQRRVIDYLDNNALNYFGGADPYLKATKKMTKKEEEESNYVRIDLDEAAKKMASRFHVDEDSEGFLETYDEYYDILYKCRK